MNATTATHLVIEFRLRQIMDERGLSVRDVSEKTGLTHSALYMMLDHMPRSIRYETMARLCLGLDVMVADLFVVRRPTARR